MSYTYSPLLCFSKTLVRSNASRGRSAVKSRCYSTSSQSVRYGESSVLSGSAEYLDVIKDLIVPLRPVSSNVSVPQFQNGPSRATILDRKTRAKEGSINAAVYRSRQSKPYTSKSSDM